MEAEVLHGVGTDCVQGRGLGAVLGALLVCVDAYVAMGSLSPVAGLGDRILVEGAEGAGGDCVELSSRPRADAAGREALWGEVVGPGDALEDVCDGLRGHREELLALSPRQHGVAGHDVPAKGEERAEEGRRLVLDERVAEDLRCLLAALAIVQLPVLFQPVKL